MSPVLPIDVAFERNDESLRFTINLNQELLVHREILACFQRGILYEAETSEFFFKLLAPGDVFIDIGAHIGFFTLLASVLVGPSGRVYAFEPEDGNYGQLTANLAANRVTNVDAFQQGLWSASKDATFFVHTRRNDGAHCLFDHGDPETRADAQLVTIGLRPLDDVLVGAPIERVRALKIDVEGAETEVLRGAAQLLERRAVDFVVCEYNSFCLRKMNTTEAELRGLMASFGYGCFALTAEAGLIPISEGRQIAAPDQDVLLNIVFATPDAIRSLQG